MTTAKVAACASATDANDDAVLRPIGAAGEDMQVVHHQHDEPLRLGLALRDQSGSGLFLQRCLLLVPASVRERVTVSLVRPDEVGLCQGEVITVD